MPIYPYAALSVPNMKRYLRSEDEIIDHHFASTDKFQPELAGHKHTLP